MIEVPKLLALVAAQDRSAIPHLREMAQKLNQLADALESGSPWKSSGGMSERIQMAVVGPEGQVVQQVDTGPVE